MRIKKFIATTMKEGKALVIKELGEDAVILSSRTSKNPSTGEDFIEIVAAMDDANAAKRATLIDLPKRDILPRSSKQESPALGGDSQQELAAIHMEISKLSQLLKYRNAGLLSPGFSRLYKLLIDNEIPESTALETVARVSASDINAEYTTAIELSRDIFRDMLEVTSPLSETDAKKVVFFAGITGSGKTSSLVKIAVICKLLYKFNILIISADTYKVGGAEQLETLSSIVGISFKAVYTPAELANEISNERERDLILIDTTGRSQNNAEHTQELRDFYEQSSADLTYIVLSATTTSATTLQILDKYSFMKISSAIITKTDEAAAMGGILISLKDRNMPISYVANGQMIPDDIEPATKERLADMLLRRKE